MWSLLLVGCCVSIDCLDTIYRHGLYFFIVFFALLNSPSQTTGKRPPKTFRPNDVFFWMPLPRRLRCFCWLLCIFVCLLAAKATTYFRFFNFCPLIWWPKWRDNVILTRSPSPPVSTTVIQRKLGDPPGSRGGMGRRTVAVVDESIKHCGMFMWHKKEAQKISVHSHICRQQFNKIAQIQKKQQKTPSD